MYSEEESGREISNRRGIKFSDCSLFCLFFSKQFGITLHNFASGKAVGCQELALNVHFLLCDWSPGSKNRISVVRGQDKGVPGPSF